MKPPAYIYPPRTTSTLPPGTLPNTQQPLIAQYKYNDTRLLIKLQPNKKPELWTRHKTKLHYDPPQTLTQQLQNIHNQLGPTTTHYLDGGLMHDRHPAIKNTIIIWDILAHNNQYLLNTTYQQRTQILQQLTQGHPKTHWETIDIGTQIQPNIIIPDNHNPNNHHQQLWKNIHTINKPHTQPLIEGLLYKKTNDKLKIGLKESNNGHWQVKSRLQTGRHNF